MKISSVEGVVTKLRTILLSGDVPPGDRLPSERELGRLLGVSRPTIREALRIVEAHGLVEIRLGGNGGAFFRGPDPSTVGSALSTLLTIEASTERDLNEFRFSFEQENAALAASRATPAQRAQVAALVGRLEAAGAPLDWQTVRETDLAMHELLPALTQNSVRIAISIGVHDALARTVTGVEPQTSVEDLRDDIIGIMNLVVAGDPGAARAAMAAHLRLWRPSETAAAEHAASPG